MGTKLGGWAGAETEVKNAQSFMLTIAPFFVLYAIIMSMIAVDISMSLAPHFFANMFPVYHECWMVWTCMDCHHRNRIR